MADLSSEAGRIPARAAGRKAARPQESARQPAEKTTRIQLHLGEQTVKRLRVHCALAARNESKEANRMLLRFLTGEGWGRELFAEKTPDSIPTPEGSAAQVP